MEHLSRDQKAQRILDNGGVRPVNPTMGKWDVGSETRDRVYHIFLSRNECQCEDRRRGNICAHLLAAGKAQAIHDQPKPKVKLTLEQYIAWVTA